MLSVRGKKLKTNLDALNYLTLWTYELGVLV